MDTINNSMGVMNNSTDAMNNQDTSESEQSSVGGSHKSIDDRRKPTCKLCANHNLKIRSNNHKRYCLGQHCLCAKCLEKRELQHKTAIKTKDTRAYKQDKNRKELMEKKKLPKQELVDSSKPIIPFVISSKKRYMDICKSNEGLIVYEEYIRKDTIIYETEKQEIKKRRGKKRKINEEEIVEPKGNKHEELLRETLYRLVCNVYNVYDNTIWALVNEIAASIHDYMYNCSNSNEDAENSMYLFEAAKKRIFPHISEIRRLTKADEIQKSTDIQRMMTYDIPRIPYDIRRIPFYHYLSNILESSTYMSYQNNGIEMPPNPYFLTFNHLTGSTSVPPYTDISPKPSTEPSTYYRSITNDQ